MSPALANFLFEVANFALLATVLGWLLFKPIRGVLEAEQKSQLEARQREEKLRQEGDQLAEALKGARAQAEREIAEQRSAVLEQARAEAGTLKEQVRADQVVEHRRFKQELESERRREVAALVESVGRLSGASVAQLLQQVDGPSLDLALVRAACTRLKELSAHAGGSVLVEAARPLDPEARVLLEAALAEGFEERVVADLGAGVRITTAAGQVDASATGLAREAARQVGALGEEAENVEGNA